MSQSVQFWDRIAERYARQPIGDPDTYNRKVRLTQAHLTPASAVLEFGCGTGSTALIHAPKAGSILAVDSSPKMIDIARRKLADTELGNVEFRCATLFDIDRAGGFDAILGLNVLHLIADYSGTIQRAYELLKPGGVFVTSTACLAPRLYVLKPVLALGAMLGRIPEVQFISVDQLERTVTGAGFEVVEKLVPKKATGAVFLIAVKPASAPG